MPDTTQTIDPEIAAFNRAVAEGWRDHPPLADLPLPEARAVAEQVRAPWARGGPVMAETAEQIVPTIAGPLRIRVYRPHGLPPGAAPALIYIHGGGFTLFSIDTHDRLMREYAEAGGFAVIGVDYPLAPETKYPVALDLITALVLWLQDHGAAIHIDPARLALGGDSAGGNLSVATCLRLRDGGQLSLVKAILSNYGGFSARCSDESEARFGGPTSILNRAEAEQYWANYLGDPAQADDPYACPVHADLHGLPPIFFVVAEQDLVAEHSLTMHHHATDAGVDTLFKSYAGATHSFLEAMSVSALAREAIADGAAFVRSRL
jgi:acetyl esterase